ncbi:hypothetical protein PVK06_038268 [Gossypium arboreum]|uniref:Pectinesterase inhibitor domain-containing protein n=2 Tax=Gossypium arboreum TaxID=29729 RepID=A0ABR0MZN3_GOSAR|nr:hypothetical protein PVK06_038268 [Gossypium arboreum]
MAHKKYEPFLNKSIDHYDEIALVVGKDMAIGSFARTFADIDLDYGNQDSVSIDCDNEKTEEIRTKVYSSGTAKLFSIITNVKKNIQESVVDEQIKFVGEQLGEIANALEQFTADKTPHLYEEVMSVEEKGFDDDFLCSVFDYLVSHESEAKAFLVKKQRRGETMGINHFILTLISLTCLFSFSTSTDAPPPLSDASGSASLKLYDMIEIMSESPSPFAFDGTILESIEDVLSILPGGVDPALQEICGNTDHPIECIKATMPFLDEKAPIKPLSVLKAGVEAMDNQTKNALAEVTKLSMNPTTLKNVVPILQTCIDVYNNILNNDQKSLEAITNHNLVKLSTELGANVENVLGCENAFKQAKLESPMKEMDAKLAKIISNTLTIGVDMVHF